MSIEMITTSIIIIVLYTLAARALGKLTSDSVRLPLAIPSVAFRL